MMRKNGTSVHCQTMQILLLFYLTDSFSKAWNIFYSKVQQQLD